MRIVRLAICLVTIGMFTAGISPSATGRPTRQAAGDEQRDFGFFSRFRPQGSAARRKKTTYRRKGTAIAPTAIAADAAIGITFWRAHDATRRDPIAARDIVQKGDGTTQQLTLVRLGADPELSVGDDFRIGVETSRTGYLYVVNRSVRADGSTGAPYLIFPTRRIRGGDNRVRGGQIVMLPTPPDEEPFEILDPQGDLASEAVLVLVAPKPLDVEVRDGRYELPAELVDGWVRRWSAPTETYELEGSGGALYTVAEKAAATRPGRLLKSTDPAPQVIQRIAAKPGDPLLLHLIIRVRRAPAT